MLRIERYLFRTAATAFLAGLFTLTAVIWVTQALKQLDLMTSKGQTILVFLTITSLGLPFLTAVIAPVALFTSVLYCLNKLNSDSELVVMSAAGVSTVRLLRPFFALFALVFLAVAGAVHRDHAAEFRRDPGAHRAHSRGFYRQFRAPRRLHRAGGRIRLPLPRPGVPTARCAASSSRTGATPPQISHLHIARSARSSKRTAKPTCCCSRAAPSARAAPAIPSIITFDDYAIDLSQFMHKGDDDQAAARAQHLGPPGRIAERRDAAAVGRAVARRTVRSVHQPALRLFGRTDRFRRTGRGAHDPARARRGDRNRHPHLRASSEFSASRSRCCMRGKPGVPVPLWVPVGTWAIPTLRRARQSRRHLRRPADAHALTAEARDPEGGGTGASHDFRRPQPLLRPPVLQDRDVLLRRRFLSDFHNRFG